MTPDCDGGVVLMVALPASRSMPIGARPPYEGLTTSIFWIPLFSHSAASVGNRAPPHGGGASGGVLSSASDDDGGGFQARCASSANLRVEDAVVALL
jgi:hypothetical protein